MRNYMTSSQDCDDDVNDDGYLKQTPFILQWSIRFRGGSEEPHRARTITLVRSWLDEYGGAFVFLHLSIIFIGRFSLLSIKEEEVYHLFWNGNISTQNASISNWFPPSEEGKILFLSCFSAFKLCLYCIYLKSWYSAKRIHTNVSYQCYHTTLKMNFKAGSLRKPSYQMNGSYVSYVLHIFGPSLQIDFKVEPSYQRNGSQKCDIFPSSGSWERPGSRLEIWGSFESGLPWNSLWNFSNELQASTCICIFICLRICNSTCSSYQCYVQLWAILVSVSLCPWNTQDCSLPEKVFSYDNCIYCISVFQMLDYLSKAKKQCPSPEILKYVTLNIFIYE